MHAFAYPKDWEDDQRMGLLLAEFRVRSLNPENYDSKLKFWRDLICKYCLEAKQSPSVSIAELKEAFKRNGTRPYCLETVFEEMTKAQEVQTKAEFMLPISSTLTGWAIDSLVKRPLRWGFNKMKDTVWKSKDDNTEFIILGVLKRQSEEILRLAHKAAPNNSLITMHEIAKLAQDHQISGDGLQMALQNLSNQKLVAMEPIEVGLGDESPQNWLLKFAGPITTTPVITEIERSIFTLEQTEHRLMRAIDDIEANIGQQQQKIKDALRDGKKQVAKNHLRKRKNFEQELEKRSNVLDNVQTMLHRINGTQSDKEVIDAYKMGSNALKRAFAESGLSIDNVEDTIAEMRDVLDVHNEIQAAVNEPLSPISQVDDKELEDELMELLNNDIPPTSPGPAVPKVERVLKVTDADFDEEIQRRLRGLRFDVPNLDATVADVAAGNVSSAI